MLAGLSPLFRRPLHDAGDTQARGGQVLRLLSYNIQVGIETKRYRQYLLHSWKHVLPHRARLRNLDAIAKLISSYDVVSLQEVDGGSLRTSYINQIRYLADHAGFDFWLQQTNRRIGRIAQHSNGLLSRCRPERVEEHALPGFISGRGALCAWFGHGEQLLVINLHLAIGRVARLQQLAYVAELVQSHRHVIVMGDLNLQSHARDLHRFLKATGLRQPGTQLRTYPSWHPRRSLDHILVSPSLHVSDMDVLDFPLSDHLPIVMNVRLPAGVHFDSPCSA